MGATILEGDWKFYQSYGLKKDALFNLADVPMEEENVLSSNPELTERLRGKLDTWLDSVDAKMPRPAKKFADDRPKDGRPCTVSAYGFCRKTAIGSPLLARTRSSIPSPSISTSAMSVASPEIEIPLVGAGTGLKLPSEVPRRTCPIPPS